jgi:hypothetical protein
MWLVRKKPPSPAASFLANIAWLLAQAFIIGVYFVGAVLMFNVVRHELNAIPATA